MKYTPQTVAAILLKLEEGVPEKWACQACGIGISTYHEWKVERPEFGEQVQQAIAKCVAAKVAKIKYFEDKTEKPAQWWLERRTEEFKNSQGLEVMLSSDPLKEYTDDEVRTLAEIEAARRSREKKAEGREL